MKGGRSVGRQKKRWEDNIREWTGLEFGKSQRAVEHREKMEKTDCKIICGAPTTLAVKGLMMMMMSSLVEKGVNLNLTGIKVPAPRTSSIPYLTTDQLELIRHFGLLQLRISSSNFGVPRHLIGLGL